MYLIVGLGNPGAEYSRTRHNIGWMVLDELSRRHSIAIEKKQNDARVGGGFFASESGEQHKVLLAKPQTYMNLSGRAVSALMRFHRIPRENLLVVCDDLNLPVGKLRLRASGSDGGQNGLKSVAQMISSTGFARLRFGIGAPLEAERRERGSAAFVLRAFDMQERPLVDESIGRACDCIERIVSSGVIAAMNEYNG